MQATELRDRRQALGLSVAELAARFDVLPSTVYRWEAGDGPPKGIASVGVDLVLRRLESQKRRERRP